MKKQVLQIWYENMVSKILREDGGTNASESKTCFLYQPEGKKPRLTQIPIYHLQSLEVTIANLSQ